MVTEPTDSCLAVSFSKLPAPQRFTNCTNKARRAAKVMNSNCFLFKGLLCEAAAIFQSNQCAVEEKNVGPFEKEKRGQWLLPWPFPNFIIPDCALQRIQLPPLPGFLNMLTPAGDNWRGE